MDKKLAAKIKKYKICPVEYKTGFVSGDTAKSWLASINKFLEANNLDDASIYCDIDGEDAYLDCIRINAQVDKSEEQLREEVAEYEASLLAAKEAEDKRKRQYEEEERKQYERLKKKYG